MSNQFTRSARDAFDALVVVVGHNPARGLADEHEEVALEELVDAVGDASVRSDLQGARRCSEVTIYIVSRRL